MGLSSHQKAQRQQKRSQKKRLAEKVAKQKSRQENLVNQGYESTVCSNNTKQTVHNINYFIENTPNGAILYKKYSTDIDRFCEELLTIEQSKNFIKHHFDLIASFGLFCYLTKDRGLLVNPGLVSSSCPRMAWHYELFYATEEDIINLPYLSSEEKLNVLSRFEYNQNKEIRVLLHRANNYHIFRIQVSDDILGSERTKKAIEMYRSKKELDSVTWTLDYPPYEIRLLTEPNPDRFYIGNLYCH